MKLKKRITFLKKSDKAKKGENFFRDKLLLPIIATVAAGLVATYISNYLAKQGSYNDLVDKYTTKLKEIVISDRLNSIVAEINELKSDEAYLEKEVEKTKNKDTFDLDKLHVSKKVLVDESLLTKDKNDNTLKPSQKQIESILKFIQDRLEQKDQERAQIRGLMNTITVNTLISLSEDDAFIPKFSNTFLSFIPPFKSRNVERRDIIINALRLSELGIGNRLDGEAKFPLFLENTKIGGYSLQTGAVINLKKIDLSIGYLNGSTFTLVDLGGANFNYAELNGSSFSESSLNNVNFAKAKMEKARFSNSSVKNSIFDDSFLKGMQAVSERSNRICTSEQAKLFEVITGITSFKMKGIKCNVVDFSGSSFINSDLTNANLTNANLTNANLTNANLTNANLTNANLTNVNLTNSTLNNIKGLYDQGKIEDYFQKMSVKLCNTGYKNDSSKQVKLFNDCKNSNLSGKNLYGVNFNWVDLTGANLTSANLTSSIGIKLQKTTIVCNTKLPIGQKSFVDCKNADLTSQDLSGVDLQDSGIDFTNAILQDATGLDIPETVKAKFCNTTLPNGVKRFDNCENSNLDYQNLKGLNLALAGANFTKANLSGANLSGTNLTGLTFINANLTNANLENSMLDIKSLDKATLCNTTLPSGSKSFEKCKGADLSNQALKELNLALIDLTNANLSGTDLSGTNLTNATLTNADLTSTNLEHSVLNTKSLKSLKKVKKLCNTILPSGIKSFEKCKEANLTDADLTNADLTKAKDLELQQLEKAILCHTKLPAKLAAQNIENRDCPKK